MKTLRYLLIALLAGFTASCRPADEPSPADTRDPRNLWNYFWQDMRIVYPFFELDGVDWGTVNDRVRPRLSADTPSDSLFSYMVSALDPLLDGHASLSGKFGGRDSIWSHPERQTYFPAFSVQLVVRDYLRQDPTGYQYELVQMGYPEPGILYIWIRTFETAGVAAKVDSALRAGGAALQGVVLDVRSNGGGLIAESEAVASNFIVSSRTWGREKLKNGPGQNDFTSYQPLTLTKRSGYTFRGKVAVLTNRYSASASERLRLMLRGVPTVVSVGDTTYGATSPIVQRILPNGWSYVSVGSVTEDERGINYERVGVPPDVVVQNTRRQLQIGQDAALEEAIRRVRP